LDLISGTFQNEMPTYDYECKSCQHTWEVFQSIKAAPIKKCPECGKNQAKRVIGPGAGILFKGSGFYITDYRSDSYKKAAASDAKASGSGSSDSGSGSSSKSDKSSS
jgi:putative FmdB family regulatory protein